MSNQAVSIDIMDDMPGRPTAIAVRQQGAVVVSHAYLMHVADNIVCLFLHCDCKYPTADTRIDGDVDSGPEILLDVGKNTLYAVDNGRWHATAVELSDYMGWRVFAVHEMGYEVAVVLVKPETMK